MELTIRVHEEDGGYWAEVVELPGCFASGTTLDELREALEEAIVMYLEDEASASGTTTNGHAQQTMRIEQLKVLL